MANPVLSDKRTATLASPLDSQARPLTRSGVVAPLGLYTAIALVAGTYGWHAALAVAHGSGVTTPVLLPIAIFGALILGFVIAFVPRLAAPLGWIYAGFEGVFLGLISGMYNVDYPGIVVQALGATAATACVVWFLYATGVIKVTSKLRRAILVATLGALVFYLVALVLTLVGGSNILTSGGPTGVAISLVMCGIASANLLIDFDAVDRSIAASVPSSSRWYFAFALFVTLVWMYLEMLRLLARARR